MPAEVKLSPNIPLQLALADPSGVPEDFRVHFPTSDGRVLTLPRKTAIELNRLDLKPGEAFCICRDVKKVDTLASGASKGMMQVSYRVWLPAATEQERAAEEAEAEPAPILPPVIEAVARRRKPAKRDDQPRLFDRGTGTYGPMPQQVPIPEALTAQIRASGPIPMDLAFAEVTAFVTTALKDVKEQWNDQAKQDAICTIMICASKQKLLSLWRRK